MNFIDKKISVHCAISILAKNEIIVDEQEADIILDFLYLIAKNCNKSTNSKKFRSLRRFRTVEKTP